MRATISGLILCNQLVRRATILHVSSCAFDIVTACFRLTGSVLDFDRYTIILITVKYRFYWLDRKRIS